MAYFQHPEDEEADWDAEEQDTGWVDDDEQLFDDEERRESHRGRMRVLAGLGDFIGVILGTVCILLLVALLISLLNWLRADVGQSFTLLQSTL